MVYCKMYECSLCCHQDYDVVILTSATSDKCLQWTLDQIHGGSDRYAEILHLVVQIQEEPPHIHFIYPGYLRATPHSLYTIYSRNKSSMQQMTYFD